MAGQCLELFGSPEAPRGMDGGSARLATATSASSGLEADIPSSKPEAGKAASRSAISRHLQDMSEGLSAVSRILYCLCCSGGLGNAYWEQIRLLPEHG